jgi:hypothetical protein
MTHRLTLLAALCLALVGCGGETGLVAQGIFTATGPGFTTGVDLADETRIDAGGMVTGSCVITDSAAGRSVVIDLFTSGATADNQMRHGSLTARVGSATASLSADIGTRTFSSSTCAATVDAIDLSGNAIVSTDGACTLSSGDGSTVAASANLVLFGCRVLPE